jgi:hypothetical protein
MGAFLSAVASRLGLKPEPNQSGWSIEVNVLSPAYRAVSKFAIAIFSPSALSKSKWVIGIGAPSVAVAAILIWEVKYDWPFHFRFARTAELQAPGPNSERPPPEGPLAEPPPQPPPPAPSPPDLAEALVPLIQGPPAVWAFDSAEDFEVVGAATAALARSLPARVCGQRLIIAYGSASSEGPRAYNEQLSDTRSTRIAQSATNDAVMCAGTLPVVAAVRLGQSLAEQPSPEQRRVVVAGLSASTMARGDWAEAGDVRAFLARASAANGLPSPDDYSSFDFCWYSGPVNSLGIRLEGAHPCEL